jgi:radical SAM protein with 4Fe4S-binding SPASM domain
VAGAPHGILNVPENTAVAAKKSFGIFAGMGRTPVPRIHIAYMLLRSYISEIYLLPELVKGQGVNSVVISTLDFAPNAALERETISPECEDDEGNLRILLSRAQERLSQSGVGLHFRLPSISNPGMRCTENILKSLVIASNGDVTPCVYANAPLHLSNSAQTIRWEKLESLKLGNVKRDDLSTIWTNSNYKDFRESHIKRNFHPACKTCAKLVLGTLNNH